MLKSKKAQGLPLNTVVLLILAVVVLVVIIAGVVMGWSNMWERVQGFFSKSNVDATVATCTIQCTTQQKQEFCCTAKTLREVDPDTKKIITSEVQCKDAKLLGKIECAGKETLCTDYSC